MTTTLLLIVLLALAPPGSAASQPAARPMSAGPGVSQALAGNRAAALSDLRYALRFEIPELRSGPIAGTITISLTARERLEGLVLDFVARPEQVGRVLVDGSAVDVVVADEHILLAGPLAPGAHTLSVDFVAGDDALNRSDEFLYSLFVPSRARLTFPCFDQPDLKARVSLTLETPEGWEAVSNGAQIERRVSGGRAEVRFAETPPLSTYLFAFAAGKFTIETASRAGRTLRMFHRETDEKKLARNRDTIFDLHAASLAWLERYTGLPYPWGKFDFLLAPAFQFGGMEHPGAIFYNAPALLLDETATTNQLLGRASLIAHETAHMWFGDLVTMRWFDDVWMKEVFANFMAAKVVNPSFPGINHDLRFLLAYYPAAYEVDRSAGTHPIRQALDNLSDAGSLYGAIIYQKAPIVMRQLERLMGDEHFQLGLREYLRKYAWGNASWPELIRILDDRSPDDLAAWSRVWVEDEGRPVIRASLEPGPDGTPAQLLISQEDPEGRGRVWPQLLEVAFGTSDGPRMVPVRVGKGDTTVEVPDHRSPTYVLAAGGGLGYARFELDRASREWLLANLPDEKDPLTRGAAWVTLWDEMLEGRVTPSAVVELSLRTLGAEGDDLNLQRVLAYLEAALWRFSTPQARQRLAPRVEQVLREGLLGAPAGPVKAAWFQTFVRLALTPESVGWLEALWRGDVQVEGLTLAEADFTKLAQELALRDVAGTESMLDRQLARIDNPDRRERFAFVRPALSADASVRERFFDSLRQVDNRRREPWVVEALAYLHHPLRAGEAERFVQPSLELLEEIKRTGDIFFPRRWMDATLWGHQSATVADTVERFLDGRPAYPLHLRRIVLQAADELLRAVRLLDGRAASRESTGSRPRRLRVARPPQDEESSRPASRNTTRAIDE